jgi:hypothetical protein
MYVDEESNLTTKAEYDAAVSAGAVIPETLRHLVLPLPET